RRHSGGGIAMDHGSHSLYLLFDWLASFPTTVSAHLSNGIIHDTEEDFNCTIGFPAGYATVHLTWTAGVRKVMYTLHGEKGSIRVEDDDIEVAHMRADPTMSYQGSWEFERTKVSSNWMDSSHVSWFNSLFDDFRVAIAANDYVSDDLRTSRECVRLIEAAYESAAQQSRQVALDHPTALAIVEGSLAHADAGVGAIATVEAA
ncbi:MAG: Gfo/Idh/MocA family oxidoreductase, partial [Gemmatimonadaceae bacterium]